MVSAFVQKWIKTWRAWEWNRAHPNGIFNLKKKPKVLHALNTRTRVFNYIRTTYVGIPKENIERKLLKRAMAQFLDGAECAGVSIKHTWFGIDSREQGAAALTWILPFAHLVFTFRPDVRSRKSLSTKDARDPMIVRVALGFRKSPRYGHFRVLDVYSFTLHPTHIQYGLDDGVHRIIRFSELDRNSASAASAWRQIFEEIEYRARKVYIAHKLKSGSFFE